MSDVRCILNIADIDAQTASDMHNQKLIPGISSIMRCFQQNWVYHVCESFQYPKYVKQGGSQNISINQRIFFSKNIMEVLQILLWKMLLYQLASTRRFPLCLLSSNGSNCLALIGAEARARLSVCVRTIAPFLSLGNCTCSWDLKSKDRINQWLQLILSTRCNSFYQFSDR